MKRKLYAVFTAVSAMLIMASCEKCVECQEPSLGAYIEFCGNKSDRQDYESGMKNTCRVAQLGNPALKCDCR